MTWRSANVICLDSSLAIDYLEGEPYVETLLDGVSDTVAVPRIVRYELYVGALRSRDPTKTIDAVDQALSWTQTLEFTDAAARETATIRAGLLDTGDVIGAADTLIAGTAREAGATLLTLDDDFERVPNLSLRVIDPTDSGEDYRD
jgi:tRNA(fMet)-specific endonuclease VapC